MQQLRESNGGQRGTGVQGHVNPGSVRSHEESRHKVVEEVLAGAETTAAYRTDKGLMVCGLAEQVLEADRFAALRGEVQLLFTSPPFPLNRKKKYDNKQGQAYVEWLASYAHLFAEIIKPAGSIVLEVGNAWEPGLPVMSTLALEALLRFKTEANLYLCQQFVCHNPARLPTPAQWVNVERCRVKDSFTSVWWLAKEPKPKANNRNVLRPYSAAMEELLRKGAYNSGRRPSEHQIGERSFLKNNGGAIPSNVLTFTNTAAGGNYMRYCKEHGLPVHPARMPPGLAEFFIDFLTDVHDLVLDPFAGSNTTGAAAERLGRHWVSIEADRRYVAGSRGRFGDEARDAL